MIRKTVWLVGFFWGWFLSALAFAEIHEVIADVQPKMVKIYGAGGFQGLEAYQSGFFISGEGLLLTPFTPALDSEEILCVTHDGNRFTATVQQIDPVLELALLKVDAQTPDFWDLELAAAQTREKDCQGTEILAFSNLFNIAMGSEDVSVQRGRIASQWTLNATRGAYPYRYRGLVYTLDVTTNNPGAAGGALVSLETGELLGMLGKELQHNRTRTWLNFAIPAHVLQQSVAAMLQGKTPDEESYTLVRKKPQKGTTLAGLGIRLVPEVVEKTPPYVDGVVDDSRAARADVQPDDLILFLNGKPIQSCEEFRQELEWIDEADKIKCTFLRQETLWEKEF